MKTTRYKLKFQPKRYVIVPKECYSDIEKIVEYITTRPFKSLSYKEREEYQRFADYASIMGKINPKVVEIMDKFYLDNSEKRINGLKDSLFLHLCGTYLSNNYPANKEIKKIKENIIEKARQII